MLILSLISSEKNFNEKKVFWPLESGVITSHVGKRWGGLHTGIDISAKKGTAVFSGCNGRIEKSFNDSLYGNRVEIKCKNGLVFSYSHLKKLILSEGDAISIKEKIGEIGMSGKTTGPHLHFETYNSNKIYLNPINVIGNHPYRDLVKEKKNLIAINENNK